MTDVDSTPSSSSSFISAQQSSEDLIMDGLDESKLTIEVVEGENLYGRDIITGLSDPYCMLFMTSSAEHHKTKVVKKTLDPKWNEIFHFTGIKQIQGTKLVITVYDNDVFTKKESLGEIMLNLSDL
eukprot:CAMPEP_0168549890 /NCGR_PEP_ID=MMETSP0413-20121227/5344_1 /TAXON_ID=136452 /ORGANISM="Filamoeba nolandi, Strain NC-AS-23-1" /LENGTH=125 /DNA_ID=CAMNT_0008580307 /DNA_START=23 /DNA_END=396 /DNA_ORIENTATION=+